MKGTKAKVRRRSSSSTPPPDRNDLDDIQYHKCIFEEHNCELNPQPKDARFRYKKALCSFTMASPNSYTGCWHMRTRGAIYLEIIRHLNSSYWYIIHPYSLFKTYWEVWMFFLTAYTIMFRSIRISFFNPFTCRVALQNKNYTVDRLRIVIDHDTLIGFLWLFDMFLNFFCGYQKKDTGVIVMEPRRIFCRYFFRRFLFYLSCSVPLDYIIYRVYGMDFYCNIKGSSFIFLTIYDAYTLTRTIGYTRSFFEWRNYEGNLILCNKLLIGVIYYFYVIHATACVGAVMPVWVNGDIVMSGNYSWFLNQDHFRRIPFEQYAHAFKKSLLIHHRPVGFSTFPANLVYPGDFLTTITASLCSKIFTAHITATLLEAITATHVLKTKFNLILHRLNNYMALKEFPLEVKKQLSRFYLYRFQAYYLRDRAIIGELTSSLKKDIEMFTCPRLIHNCEVFRPIPRKYVSHLVQTMNREMYFPNDVIIQGNTFEDSMYFICSGVVSVTTSSGTEICRLRDGDFFGEICLIFQDKRIATVVAVTITEVYRLNSTAFKKMIELFPEVYTRLERIAWERYRMTLSLENKDFNG